MMPRSKLIPLLAGVLIATSAGTVAVVYAESGDEGALAGVPPAEQFTIEHTDCSGTVQMLEQQEGKRGEPLDCQRVVPTDPEAAQSDPDHYAPLNGSPEVAAQLCEAHLDAVRDDGTVDNSSLDALDAHCDDLRGIADAEAAADAPN